MAETLNEALERLGNLKSSQELEFELGKLITEGVITRDKAADYYDLFMPRIEGLPAQRFAEAQRGLESARTRVSTQRPPVTDTFRPSPRLEQGLRARDIGVAQTGRFQSWFASKYANVLREFRAGLPRFEQAEWLKIVPDESFLTDTLTRIEQVQRRMLPEGRELSLEEATPLAREMRALQADLTSAREGLGTTRVPMSVREVETQVESDWLAFVEKQKPEFRKQWLTLSPFERGERPAAHAPRIKTVGF